MEMPRGLIVILGLLSLGVCWDISAIVQGGPGVVIMLLILAGRIAAIVGIFMRSRIGWWLAVTFFGLIVGLNALVIAANAAPITVLFGVLVPAGCLVYLVTVRSEFG